MGQQADTNPSFIFTYIQPDVSTINFRLRGSSDMRTVLVVLFVFFFLVLTIPVMFVEWIIGKFNPDVKDRSSIKIVQWAFRCVLFLSGTKITVIGEENVPKDEPVLYIGNHRSYFDVVITYARTPGLCGYISKKEIERIPLLNIWMRYLPKWYRGGFSAFPQRQPENRGKRGMRHRSHGVKPHGRYFWGTHPLDS